MAVTSGIVKRTDSPDSAAQLNAIRFRTLDVSSTVVRLSDNPAIP